MEAQVRSAGGDPGLVPPVTEGPVVERVAGSGGEQEPHPSGLGEPGQVRLKVGNERWRHMHLAGAGGGLGGVDDGLAFDVLDGSADMEDADHDRRPVFSLAARDADVAAPKLEDLADAKGAPHTEKDGETVALGHRLVQLRELLAGDHLHPMFDRRLAGA